MDRRTYLRSLGVAGMAGVAGCLEAVPGVGAERADGAVLRPPENPYDPSYPTYGDEIPQFSVPNLDGEEITPERFEGERAFFMTFIYTQCHDAACPALAQQLHYVQQRAQENGYEEDVAFLAATFDPERDTPETLREFGDIQGIDHEADNWHFLRLEDYEEGLELYNETLGVGIQRVDMDDEDVEGSDGENDDSDGHHGDDDGHHGDEENDHHEDDDGHHGDDGHHDHAYHFNHNNLILLVNRNGVVERAYPTRETREDRDKFLDDPNVLVEDLETVIEGS